MIQVGAVVRMRPTILSSKLEEEAAERKGVVIYVHPDKRFYTVEFTSQITGERWRECVYFR